jgi:hypothetical protein
MDMAQDFPGHFVQKEKKKTARAVNYGSRLFRSDYIITDVVIYM